MSKTENQTFARIPGTTVLESVSRFFFLESYSKESSAERLFLLLLILNLCDCLLTYYGLMIFSSGTASVVLSEGNQILNRFISSYGPFYAMFGKFIFVTLVTGLIFETYKRQEQDIQEFIRYGLLLVLVIFGTFGCLPWAFYSVYQLSFQLVLASSYREIAFYVHNNFPHLGIAFFFSTGLFVILPCLFLHVIGIFRGRDLALCAFADEAIPLAESPSLKE